MKHRFRTDEGSAIVEFIGVAVLCVAAVVGSLPLIELQLQQQRVMRSLDAYTRAVLAGAQVGQAQRYGATVAKAIVSGDPRNASIRFDLACVVASNCLAAGGLLRVSAVAGRVSESAVVDLPKALP